MSQFYVITVLEISWGMRWQNFITSRLNCMARTKRNCNCKETNILLDKGNTCYFFVVIFLRRSLLILILISSCDFKFQPSIPKNITFCMYVSISLCLFPNITINVARSAIKQTTLSTIEMVFYNYPSNLQINLKEKMKMAITLQNCFQI